MTEIEGSYFNSGSSTRQPALLTVSESGQVKLFDSGSRDHLRQPACTFSDLVVSPRLGDIARHINFVDGSSFETLHNDEIDKLQKQYQQNRAYHFIHFLERHSLIVFLVVILASGFIWGSVKYAVPAVATVTAKMLPVEVGQYLGQGTLQILDKTFFSPSELTSSRQQELSRLFKEYSVNDSKLNITVKFRKGEDIGANAMALPDGQIIFTDELVNLAQDDLELVAIFGHEMGHLAHRHMLRRVIQGSMITVLVVLITGDVSSASSIVFAIPGLLLELAYSRKFEIEADDFAYDFLVKNDIRTQHYANIMQRLMNEKEAQERTDQTGMTDAEKNPESNEITRNITPYLSTHPATNKRIKRFLEGPKPGL